MNIARLTQQLFIILAFSALVACGGSGDGPTFTGVNDGAGSAGTPRQSVNGGLRGRYFSSTDVENGEWLDLNTGESSEFREGSHTVDNIAISQDGTEYIELVVNNSLSSNPTSTIRI